MRVCLVVPALASLGATLAGVPALAQLAAFAGPPHVEPRGLASALPAAVELPADTPPAPLAARGAGLSPADGDVQYADPVTLVAGRDDVLLSGRVADLAPDECAALLATLNAHFAADGLAFAAPAPDAWFALSRDVPLPVTTPLGEVDGAIAPQLPRGPHARPWRRWTSEIQMLLHEHPVNVAREAAGRAPVTGVWLWGGGPLVQESLAPSLAIYAAPGRAGDVARGLGAAAPVPPDFAGVAPGRDTLVVLPAVHDAAALPALVRDWLAPAVAALAAGTVRQLTLLADDGRSATAWRAQAPSWWQRAKARVGATRFAVPERPE